MQSILKRLITIGLMLFGVSAHANPDNMGQTLQIETALSDIIGTPTWSLVIRDVEHNQTIPYLFTFDKLENHWIAITYSHHYLIQSSQLQLANYHGKPNGFSNYRTHDFCHLESKGRILHDTSFQIRITGTLSQDRSTYQCQIIRFKDPHFNVQAS